MADIKILAKVLANRLQRVVGSLIAENQSGFIPIRSTSDNIHHLFLNIQTLMDNSKKAAILLLGTAKAFNEVEWCFLWQVMIMLGFDPFYMRIQLPE